MYEQNCQPFFAQDAKLPAPVKNPNPKKNTVRDSILEKYDLVDAINFHIPAIDKMLEEENVPVFDRVFKASLLFVELVVIDSSFKSKKDLLKSEAYSECILPPINDWYWEKYGRLMEKPIISSYSGLVSLYSQPILIKIPSTLSKVEKEGESAWLIFPDHLYDSENIYSMFEPDIDIENSDVSEEAVRVISSTRSINLAIPAAARLSEEARRMSVGIWGHFEKAISDILTFKNEVASIGCWELHLAIEKSFKVLLNQKTGDKHTGHNLTNLGEKLLKFLPEIDLSPIDDLPSDKEAINLRYSEKVRTVNDAVKFYQCALSLVYTITSELEKSLEVNNASILVKMAPWAR